MINRVILVGNLTRDADAVATNGKAMTRMRLATNSRWTDQEGNKQESTEFHALVAFGRVAEMSAQYCRKGRRLYVEGRLRTRDYEDGDGVRRLVTEIVADTVRLLDRGSATGDETESEPDGAAAGRAQG